MEYIRPESKLELRCTFHNKEDPANAVTAPVGAGGKVSVYNAQGSIDVVLDVVGLYRECSWARLNALTPTRVIDSRPKEGPMRCSFDGEMGAGSAPERSTSSSLRASRS